MNQTTPLTAPGPLAQTLDLLAYTYTHLTHAPPIPTTYWTAPYGYPTFRPHLLRLVAQDTLAWLPLALLTTLLLLLIHKLFGSPRGWVRWVGGVAWCAVVLAWAGVAWDVGQLGGAAWVARRGFCEDFGVAGEEGVLCGGGVRVLGIVGFLAGLVADVGDAILTTAANAASAVMAAWVWYRGLWTTTTPVPIPGPGNCLTSLLHFLTTTSPHWTTTILAIAPLLYLLCLNVLLTRATYALLLDLISQALIPVPERRIELLRCEDEMLRRLQSEPQDVTIKWECGCRASLESGPSISVRASGAWSWSPKRRNGMRWSEMREVVRVQVS